MCAITAMMAAVKRDVLEGHCAHASTRSCRCGDRTGVSAVPAPVLRSRAAGCTVKSGLKYDRSTPVASASVDAGLDEVDRLDLLPRRFFAGVSEARLSLAAAAGIPSSLARAGALSGHCGCKLPIIQSFTVQSCRVAQTRHDKTNQ